MKVSANLELCHHWHAMRRNLQALGLFDPIETDYIYTEITSVMLGELVISLASQFFEQAPEMVSFIYLVAKKKDLLGNHITEEEFYELAKKEANLDEDGFPDWIKE